jgi:hypothetical protein
MRIRKLGAARHQLEAAVQLYFADAHPVPVHTLVSAAYAILRDINEKRGGSFMVKDLHKLVGPERAADLRKRFKRSENFFKHADTDPEGEIKFKAIETPLPLFEAILKYSELTGEQPPQLMAFAIWFLLENRDALSKDSPYGIMVEKMLATNPPRQRAAFFREAVESLRESRSADDPGGA